MQRFEYWVPRSKHPIVPAIDVVYLEDDLNAEAPAKIRYPLGKVSALRRQLRYGTYPEHNSPAA